MKAQLIEKEISGVKTIGKSCNKCEEWKALYEFNLDKSSSDGHVTRCKSCLTELRRNNREKESERGRKYRENNQAKERERRRIYHENNREKLVEKTRNWRKENPGLAAEQMRKCRKENPNKYNLSTQRRRARKKSLPNDFTNDQLAKTFEIFGGCALTGEASNLHWDHVVPLATGIGGTTFGNMIPLRGDLNTSKSDANIFEWFSVNKERFQLSQDKFDHLIEWLASINGMTMDEYRSFVDECFDNRRKEAI